MNVVSIFWSNSWSGPDWDNNSSKESYINPGKSSRFYLKCIFLGTVYASKIFVRFYFATKEKSAKKKHNKDKKRLQFKIFNCTSIINASGIMS